jgi:hypothetical protein
VLFTHPQAELGERASLMKREALATDGFIDMNSPI